MNCVAFGKLAQFCEKYLNQGMKILLVGRIQTGSYMNRDGVKVWTTDIIAEEIEFCESKKAREETKTRKVDDDGFAQMPETGEEELPFNM